MEINEMVRKLHLASHYRKFFTAHAKFRLDRREFEKETLLRHLSFPAELKRAEKLPDGIGEKYRLWFKSQRGITYIYVVDIIDSNEEIFVVTAMSRKGGKW